MTEKILLAVPTRGMVPTRWAMSLRALQSPNGSIVHAIELHDQPFDQLRNELARLTLDHAYDWIFFLDDDVVVPPEGLAALRSRDLDIVSGLYMRRHAPIRPTMAMDTVRDGHPAIGTVEEFPAGALLQVDYVGAGCLLVRRNVLEAVGDPWFEWKLHRKDIPEVERVPEDFDFCKKVRARGFKIHMDTQVRCLHLGLGKAEIYGTFSPSESPSDALAFGVGKITQEMIQGASATKQAKPVDTPMSPE